MKSQFIGIINILFILVSNVECNNTTASASVTSNIVTSSITVTKTQEDDNKTINVTKSQAKNNSTTFYASQTNNTKEDENVSEGETCSSFVRHNDVSGVLTSPNYPSRYDNNVSCLWSIQPPRNKVVLITFETFDLEEGIEIEDTCPFDFLNIFEEFSVVRRTENLYESRKFVYKRTLGTYCGTKAPEQLRTKKTGSTLYFYFHSDETKTAQGFSMKYQFLTIGSSPVSEQWPNDEKFLPSVEEEFIKIFSCIVFILVFLIIFVGSLYKCWKSTSEQLEAEGRIHHTCCCGAIRFDLVAQNRRQGGRQYLGARNERLPTPRLPTPPPEYGDVVKTEEDWNRVIQQLGEASAIALRQRMATEDVQVTYDLGVREHTPVSSVASFSEVSSTSSILGHQQPEPLPIRINITRSISGENNDDDDDETDTNSSAPLSERAP